MSTEARVLADIGSSGFVALSAAAIAFGSGVYAAFGKERRRQNTLMRGIRYDVSLVLLRRGLTSEDDMRAVFFENRMDPASDIFSRILKLHSIQDNETVSLRPTSTQWSIGDRRRIDITRHTHEALSFYNIRYTQATDEDGNFPHAFLQNPKLVIELQLIMNEADKKVLVAQSRWLHGGKTRPFTQSRGKNPSFVNISLIETATNEMLKGVRDLLHRPE